MGGERVHLGPVGSGAVTKLINNFLCGVQAAALAEGLAMAERSGLDLAQVVAVLSNGAPGSPLVKGAAPKMATKAYQPANFFPLLMAKGLNYAIRTFAEQGVELDTAKAARARFLATAHTDAEHQDMSAVIEPIRASRG
jgi:3-hydroxyisobutyrate dehydrogenase